MLTIAALLPRPEPADSNESPSVTLVVPARNERSVAPATLDALDRLDFPEGRLRIVLVDDGSDDSTGELFEEWSASRPQAFALRLPDPVGKYASLNEAIRSSPRSDLIAVCDADVQPRPAWLRRLVGPFSDPRVGATAGYLSPANADDGPVARYAAVESWVHQLVASAGKDALGLDPPTLGACAYRRSALDEVGRFDSSVSGEDVRISGALTRAGWRIRFVEAAVADTMVVHTWQDYWHQHLRWARNVFSSWPATVSATPSRHVSIAQRVETRLAAAGYADRVALLVVIAGVRAHALPRWIPRAYAAAAGVEVVVAVTKAGHARQLPRFLAATAGLFGLDVVASAAASVAHILRRPRAWRQPSRRPR